MAIQLGENGELIFRSKVVGEVGKQNGKQIVRLDLELDEDEEWVVAIGLLAVGLNMLEKARRGPTDLTISSDEESVEPASCEPQTLLEFIFKKKNYIWEFHKNDKDEWPSTLHAHEYNRGLVLDALTDNIYDKVSHNHISTMKPQRLKELHRELRASKDFKGKL